MFPTYAVFTINSGKVYIDPKDVVAVNDNTDSTTISTRGGHTFDVIDGNAERIIDLLRLAANTE